MVSSNKFRELMIAAVQTSERHDDNHIAEAQMTAFCEKRLPLAERETVQVHLATCAVCLPLFRQVSDFFDPMVEGEELVSESEIAQGWHSIWSQIEKENPAKVILPFRSVNKNRSSRAMLAMAATLLLSFGGIGWLTWQLAQERHERKTAEVALNELQNRSNQIDQRVSQLEQDSQQQIAAERGKRLEAENLLAQLQTPTDSQQSFPQNLYPNYLTLTSQKSSAEENVIDLSARAQAVLLVLTISNPLDFSEYSVELLDKRGRSIQRISGLVPTGGENTLNALLKSGGMKSGKYDLALYGQKDGKSQPLGKYELTVKLTR